jgi:hypothetical protein
VKPPVDMTRRRALAFAGVAGLLAVGLISLVMIASAFTGDDEPEIAAPAPTATATPEPTATPKPKPTPVPLTEEQKAARETAAELVRGKGFKVVRLRDYDPRRKLRVLLGEEPSGMRMAFFFVDDLYIGNDRKALSSKLRVKRAGNLQVTLTYDGDYDVRFKWDGNALVPQDALPG